MSDDVFLKGMAIIIATFRINPDVHSLNAWKALLADLPDQDYLEAVFRICRNKTSIKENVAAEIIQEVEYANSLSAEEAWQEVIGKIASVGSYGKPKFSNTAIANAVEAIGWRTLCLSEENQMNTLRAHFYRTYEAMAKREAIAKTDKLLRGNEIVNLLVQKLSLPEKTLK